MTFDPGADDVVGGRFRLRSQLGSGGFSSVWTAIDGETGATVAVKCGDDESHARSEVRDRFARALRFFRRFGAGVTPGTVVQFVDGRVDGEAVYLATEFVPGGSVDDEVDRGSLPTGIEAVRTIGIGVCMAASFLHRNGWLHLDLKPNNVLVRADHTPVLVDFNTIVPVAEGTDTLFHFDGFTPPELTPTDRRDEPVGPWSDVYALGTFLAYLLTGREFETGAESTAEWEPVDPRAHGVDCPDALAAAIRDATEPAVADRPGDVTTLLEAVVDAAGVPEQFGTLTAAGDGTEIPIRDGATVGRFVHDGPVADVVLDDGENFVSPQHATLEASDGAWVLRDTSLNGTYVRDGNEWHPLISEDGFERRRREGSPFPVDDPVASRQLSGGEVIAPVDPEYGFALRFRPQ